MMIKKGLQCCCSSWRRKCSFRVTKKMLRVYVACFSVMFATGFSLTMLFPYLPFMIHFFLPLIDDTSVGRYAGLVASSFFLGRFLSNYIWGGVSDSFGRKPVLIISNVLSAVATIVFGLSVSLPMAVASRFCLGFLNATIGVVKTVLSESSNNSNHAIGMALVTTAYGTGLVIGPALSGAIADPVNQYNFTIISPAVVWYFETFPYSLPALVSALLYMLSAAMALCIPETLAKKKDKKTVNNSSELTVQQTEDISPSTDDTVLQQTEDKAEEKKEVEKEEEEEEEDEVQNTETTTELEGFADRRNSFSMYYVLKFLGRRKSLDKTRKTNTANTELSDNVALLEEDEEPENRTERLGTRPWFVQKWKSLLSTVVKLLKNFIFFMRDRETRLALLIYCTFAFAVIGFDEIYSLWCFTSRYHGGLGFTLHEITISLSVVGVVLLPFSIFLFPVMEKLMGSINAFQVSVAVSMLIFILIPSLHYIPKGPALWVALLFMLAASRIMFSVAFPASFLFINNSVTFDKLGSVNGLGTSLTALTRTISPVFAGAIYSLSLTSQLPFPFDYHLIFLLLAGILLVVMIMAACLPKSIDKQKVVKEAPTPAENERQPSRV